MRAAGRLEATLTVRRLEINPHSASWKFREPYRGEIAGGGPKCGLDFPVRTGNGLPSLSNLGSQRFGQFFNSLGTPARGRFEIDF